MIRYVGWIHGKFSDAPYLRAAGVVLSHRTVLGLGKVVWRATLPKESLGKLSEISEVRGVRAALVQEAEAKTKNS